MHPAKLKASRLVNAGGNLPFSNTSYSNAPTSLSSSLSQSMTLEAPLRESLRCHAANSRPSKATNGTQEEALLPKKTHAANFHMYFTLQISSKTK